MIRSLRQLLELTGPVERRSLGLLVLCSVIAIGAGFFLVSPKTAEALISHGGYYYMLALFALFVFYAQRVGLKRREVWRQWLRRPGWAGLGLALATACVIWIDPFKHKILFDEYVLQGTAFHMHATKEVGTVVRAYDIAGTWLPIDTFLDKRPYFFPFLVSLLHDLTGYRLQNIFALNVALTPLFLGLVYWLARVLTGRRGPALLAVALLATMPLLGQQATGAGMELHNLTMLALVMALGVLYLRAPDGDRLALFVLGAALLSQSRYESVIFVVPTAFIAIAGWLRVRRLVLSWPVILAPLLLVPYVWHNRVLSAKPMLWQLRAGETSRFSTIYLEGNLESAWRFFFNRSVELANSWYLSALGAAGVIWVLVKAWRWARDPARPPLGESAAVLIAFGGAITGNLIMVMFYYWSRFDDVMASRFALPTCLLFALLAALVVRGLDELRVPATRIAGFGLAAWMLICCFPAISRRPYTDQNLVMLEVNWEHDIVAARPGPVLLLTNNSTIPFVLWRIPTLLVGIGAMRGEQISYHLKEGTFKEVLIAQALRPTTAQGNLGVDPEDVLPASFKIETIAQKRFGGRWLRISRLIAIEPEPVSEGEKPPGAATPTVASLL
ncbi:MAG TPA: glycosyltransferase family 39 protein [Opitutaceae bacterium]|nr:glycosyltransferase family 39 protein [Opitutaceae bacterium]